jgi:protein PhnA
MWNENSTIKVVSYRMLHHLKSEGWPQDLLDMIYLDEEELEWAKQGIVEENPNAIVHRDSNGAVLQNGDSITVIKDLNVKGSSLVAKRGTAVRNITLVHDNAEHIEGRVEGQQIVILTQYVKKNA